MCFNLVIQFKQNRKIAIFVPLVHGIPNIVHGVTFFLVTPRTVTPRMNLSLNSPNQKMISHSKENSMPCVMKTHIDTLFKF